MNCFSCRLGFNFGFIYTADWSSVWTVWFCPLLECLGTEGEKCRRSFPIESMDPRPSLLEPTGSSSYQKVALKPEHSQASDWKLSSMSACGYQGKWFTFSHWGHGRNSTPYETTVQQLADFFIFLQWQKGFSVAAIKGY